MGFLDLLFRLPKIWHSIICNNKKLIQGSLLQHKLPKYASELATGIVQPGSQYLHGAYRKSAFNEVFRHDAELLLNRIPCAAFRRIHAKQSNPLLI